MFIKDGIMVAYCSVREKVCCPFQSEARSLMRAVEYARREGMQSCVFYTDNTTLSEAVASSTIPWSRLEGVQGGNECLEGFQSKPSSQLLLQEQGSEFLCRLLGKKRKNPGLECNRIYIFNFLF